MSTGYVVLTLEFEREGRRWTAYCRELGTATFGRSLPEAEERLKDALLLHLNTLEDAGELHRFFEEHDITLHHAKPAGHITVERSISTDTYCRPYIHPVRELTSVS